MHVGSFAPNPEPEIRENAEKEGEKKQLASDISNTEVQYDLCCKPVVEYKEDPIPSTLTATLLQSHGQELQHVNTPFLMPSTSGISCQRI